MDEQEYKNRKRHEIYGILCEIVIRTCCFSIAVIIIIEIIKILTGGAQ